MAQKKEETKIDEVAALKAQLAEEQAKLAVLQNQSPEALRKMATDKMKPPVIMTIDGIDIYDTQDSQRVSEYFKAQGAFEQAQGNTVFDDSGRLVSSGATFAFVNPASAFNARYHINGDKLEVVNSNRLVTGYKNTGKLSNEVPGYVVKLDENGKATEDIKSTSFTKEYYLKNFAKLMPLEDAKGFYAKSQAAAHMEAVEQETLFGF